MSNPKYPLVEVEWIDTVQEGFEQWLEPGHQSVPARVFTSGYLFEENERQVVVVQSIKEEDGQHSGRWTIPRASIVAIRRKE